MEMGNVCLYSPLLRMGESAVVGVEGRCRSYKNGLVPDWQGLNWGSTGEVWLGMEVGNNWRGGWSVVACKHSDTSLVKELDPFGRLKDPISNGNGKIQIALVFNVSFWGHVEVFFIVEDTVFKSSNAVLEMELLLFISVVPLFDSFCKSLGDVCHEGKAGNALVIELKHHKGGVG